MGQTFIFWKEIQYGSIGTVDVFLIAGEGYPSKWTFALAEEGTYIFHKTGIGERFRRVPIYSDFLQSSFVSSLPEVITVVEDDRTSPFEF